MKKEENIPYKFESLSDLHRVLGLPKPLHPMISLVDNMDNGITPEYEFPNPFLLNFYKVAYKPNLRGKIKYGQNFYDFDEGGLIFTAPNQLASLEDDGDHTGFSLYFHPDFLLTYPLAKKIKSFGYFSYSANEALHLSLKEKDTIISIFKNIDDELQNRIDEKTQDIIISQIESLLNYSDRFYKRQFITRKAVNNSLLQQTEDVLESYFNDEKLIMQGIPTVQYLSEQLNLSPSYLSDMLRTLTGQNAQQLIQHKLIEKAKERLSNTNLSISEIAYELGFEYSQSFSRLFKLKTNQTPLEFRQSFN